QRQAVVAAAAAATTSGGSLLVVGHDARNLADGVGGPQDAALLWTPDDVDVPGFTTRRRETARRPTEAGTALDTVVHLVRG
ncbi:MAG: class I SAM-dependent methyltransferase, partial [Phycicoccus sp.]